MPRETCPICDSSAIQPFLYRERVPVHQNMLFPSAAAARSMKRGTLDMRLCRACGFAFNAAFDPNLVDYGPAYENSQDCSPAFHQYLEGLVDHLVRGCGLKNGRVVEVGCGKGAFIHKLLTHPDNHSEVVGFDPSYLGPESLGPRARVVKDFYTPTTAVPADAVICRHVIEHIPEPLDLLRTVRAAIGVARSASVFFETPCVEWILSNRVLWDFFYEHCSLFTAGSLALALERAGFTVERVKHVFGGQYLWIHGGAIGSPMNATQSRPMTDSQRLADLASAFAADEMERVARWIELIEQLAARGKVFAWGAGAKGVTFANLVDCDQQRLAGVVDVNPAKQGRYLPGAGHTIVSPAQAIAAGAAAVLVLNPNYRAEVQAAVRQLGSDAIVVDLMQEAQTCG
jgi:SAM-dependent methyltransferase